MKNNFRKSVKRWLALTMTAIMLFAMAPVTMAASTGSITISNPNEGSTYKLYKLATWSVADDGSVYNIKVEDQFTNVLTESIINTLNGQSVALTTDSDGYWPVNSTYQSYATSMAETIANGSYTEAASGIGTGSALTFDSLDLGYYLIVETATTGDVISTAPILIPVVSSTTAATVYLKSSKPTVTKVIEKGGSDYSKTTEDIGDIVSYRLDAVVPKYDTNDSNVKSDSITFTLTDQASAGLTVDLTSIAVYGVDSQGKETLLSNPSAYSVSTLTDISSTDDYNGGHSFTVSFVYSAIKGYSYVSVRYDATLNTSCVVESTGNPNEVKLTYTNNYTTGETADTEWTEVRTYTYQFSIYKKALTTSGSGYEALAGAKFVVYKYDDTKTNNYGDQVKYYYASSGTTTVSTADSTPETIDGTDYSYIFTTDADGYIYLTGLDAGKYIIKEVEAPSGYNLASDVEFEITTETQNGAAVEIRTDSNITKAGTETTGENNSTTKKVEIEDTKGVSLPGTGGIGTTIFTFGGLALVILAAIMFIVYTKKQRKQA
ncbi:MAG: SpaH/EbpB family LPXTG-anchored major pilin [Lachnospiraceae bacterium]|nr:SpaH/EbpB family LPXTG-anchored major pilin [Lachnospiraceae bacterium]